MVVENLHYRDFVSDLQHHQDPDDVINADTETPNEEDYEISLVEDPDTQAELRWMKYLHRLQKGGWGDHLAVQALANMLNVSFHIISTINPDMQPVEPLSGNSVGTIHLGLIGQFHYVALVKKSGESDTSSEERYMRNDEDEEDEAAFELACKVKGAPLETALLAEHPEIGEQIYSVAPGEGQIPIPILTDPKFEEMCNPNKYPLGRN